MSGCILCAVLNILKCGNRAATQTVRCNLGNCQKENERQEQRIRGKPPFDRSLRSNISLFCAGR